MREITKILAEAVKMQADDVQGSALNTVLDYDNNDLSKDFAFKDNQNKINSPAKLNARSVSSTPIRNHKSRKHYRAIWISDVHLGFKGCKADFLLDFLHITESEYLYLVGDIIDLWSLKKEIHWPQQHNNIIRTILGKAKHGTKVVYIPGNHDEALRDYDNMIFGNVEIKNEELHTTADGQRLLIIHGDEFDSAVKCSKIVAKLGDFLYDWLLEANRLVNYLRRKVGFPYWSLASYLKSKVPNAVKYIECFEEAVAHEAIRRHVDGLVCGHIHRASLRKINGITYCNTGDWVENCTGLVEHESGELELIHWSNAVAVGTPVINLWPRIKSTAA